MKRLAKTYALVALASLGLLSVPVAGGEGPKEYELKAAFLFNFAKFVDWPTEALTTTDFPIVIGVLGTNVNNPKLIGELVGTLRDKKINNRPLQVKEIQSLTDATNSNCHMLFILKSEEKGLSGIFAELREKSVLTVGDEIEGFTGTGGMINFVVNKDSKIRFKINNDAARKAQVRISSKLLSLAEPP